MITTREIYRNLYRHFANYEYKLANSFVYDWESDFFGMSKSGYFLEVEVKVSRSDFFRDFDKAKHRLFENHLKKRSHHVFGYPTTGDIACEYEEGRLVSNYGEYANGWSWRPWRYEERNGKEGYWVNDYGNVSIRKTTKRIYSKATHVTIREMSSIKCPNQLYFCCPEGLLKPEEIPPYAGLLYCLPTEIKMVKKAPYIHKNKQDLTKVLLQKFHNLWRYKTDIDTKLQAIANKETDPRTL